MGYFSKAIAITKSDTINTLPAWEFMNQTGTLGTYLAGSLIYVGGAGDVNVIPAGTVGVQNTVVALTVSAGGTGYTGANNVATTTNGSGSGLTVNTTVGAGAVTAVAIGNSAGSGYKVGDTINEFSYFVRVSISLEIFFLSIIPSAWNININSVSDSFIA